MRGVCLNMRRAVVDRILIEWGGSVRGPEVMFQLEIVGLERVLWSWPGTSDVQLLRDPPSLVRCLTPLARATSGTHPELPGIEPPDSSRTTSTQPPIQPTTSSISPSSTTRKSPLLETNSSSNSSCRTKKARSLSPSPSSLSLVRPIMPLEKNDLM